MKNYRNKNQPPPTTTIDTYLSSSWDIVQVVYQNMDLLIALATALGDGSLDDFLVAADIDTLAEVNAIFQDFQVGRFSNQGEAEAGTDNITTMTPLRVAQAITALATPYDNNFTGTAPPGVTNDSSEGYGVNSIWMDITADPDETYRCTDATIGAAVWIKTSLTSDELATVALSGDSDDLIEGVTQLLMTATERSRLLAMEDNATADQTDLEILNAYNNQVAAASQAEMEGGTEAAIKTMSPLRVAQAIAALGGGGGGIAWTISAITKAVTAGTGTQFQNMAADVDADLPTTPALNDVVWLANNDDSSWDVIVDAGGTNEIVEQNTGYSPSFPLAPGQTCILVCIANGGTKRWGVNIFSNEPSGGLIPSFKTASFTAVVGYNYFVDSSGGPITVTLPTGATPGNIRVADAGHAAGTNNITINPDGIQTIDDDTVFVIDQDEGDVDLGFNAGDSNWEVSADGSPNLVNVNTFYTGFGVVRDLTGTAEDFVEADAGQLVTASNAAASIYTIPANASVAYDIGATLNLFNKGAGEVTIALTTDTLSSTDNKCAQGKGVTCLKVATTEWWVIGGSA